MCSLLLFIVFVHVFIYFIVKNINLLFIFSYFVTKFISPNIHPYFRIPYI